MGTVKNLYKKMVLIGSIKIKRIKKSTAKNGALKKLRYKE